MMLVAKRFANGLIAVEEVLIGEHFCSHLKATKNEIVVIAFELIHGIVLSNEKWPVRCIDGQFASSFCTEILNGLMSWNSQIEY
jgi:hypothetical protein